MSHHVHFGTPRDLSGAPVSARSPCSAAAGTTGCLSLVLPSIVELMILIAGFRAAGCPDQLVSCPEILQSAICNFFAF